jgi:coenzyme F420-reducing hydrogenase alpha subunit
MANETDAKRTIIVDALTRVEGEGALTIRLDGEDVVDVQLRIFEPPRLFEALLRGRAAAEAPDITARICGICPVAYQMSACHAVEHALGSRPDGPLRELRRLLYCGEWIESHVLHMVMLHAPDFLGVPDVMALSHDHPERVQGALQVKKAGNAIVRVLGGREIHPINVRIGGFYRVPQAAELDDLLPSLRDARSEAEVLLDWCAGFDFPSLTRPVELVALRHPSEYPMNEGRIVSLGGLDIEAEEYEMHFVEEQVPHSTALHSTLVGRGPYVCGPTARLALNSDRLSPRAREAAERAEVRPKDFNPFRSILARGVEVVYALDEAIRIIESYQPPTDSAVDVLPRAGRGAAATEAPRGLLYHRYDLDGEANIVNAKIVPPTSQNQKSIEDDLRAIAKTLASMPIDDARARAEHAIRNYDPCISCATHFLRLSIERA